MTAVFTSGVQSVIYPVRDVEAAKAIFTALYGAPLVDQPYYVGWHVDGQDIGLDPHGHQNGLTGPVAYTVVDDIEATMAALLGAGATELVAIRPVGGGKRIAVVIDADGNPIGITQNG